MCETTVDRRLKRYIISCHLDKPLLGEEPYSVYNCPIQAGAALTEKRVCKLNDHDGFPESISARNDRYSEVTAMWWIGHHIDTPYIGIEHYRRRFRLTDEQLASYMDEGIDIITTLPIRMTWTVEENYRHSFYSSDWDLFMTLLEEYVPDDLMLAREVFASNAAYCCNMNIMRGDLYREFCGWAFPILDAFYRRSPVKTDRLQHRDVGYVTERLSQLFVEKMKRAGKRIAEAAVNVLPSDDWSPEKECDTGDFEQVWRVCDRLYREDHITECGKLLSAALAKGGGQDERLQALSEVLCTAAVERMEIPQTMNEYLPRELRCDLDTLLEVYDGFRQIVRLWKSRDDDETRRLLVDYRGLTHFSNVAVRRICQETQ